MVCSGTATFDTNRKLPGYVWKYYKMNAEYEHKALSIHVHIQYKGINCV